MLSAVLAATMVAGMMGNVVSVSAEEKYDLTLYSVNTTDPDFDDWLANVEAVSYTHLRAHETRHDIVCRLLLEKKKKKMT